RRTAHPRSGRRARGRSGACRAGRAGRRFTATGEGSAGAGAVPDPRRRRNHPDRRARHGFRDGAGRPPRGDGVRLQAGRGRPGRGARRSEGAGSLSRRRAVSPMLEIRDLHVAYGKVEAVRGVSLSLEKGQIVTVIGPNGAGKTTLLAAAIGLLPARGRLLFDGTDLFKLDVEARVERGFCLVPETRELFGELTVYDNLVLGAYPRRADRGFVNRALEEAYGRFPLLAERRMQRADTLSGGERQMLA